MAWVDRDLNLKSSHYQWNLQNCWSKAWDISNVLWSTISKERLSECNITNWKINIGGT